MSEFCCAHCGLPSGYQGHYHSPNRDFPLCPNSPTDRMVDTYGHVVVVGFCCPQPHVCKPDIAKEPTRG